MADPVTTLTPEEQGLANSFIARAAAKAAAGNGPSTLSQPATSQWTTVGDPPKEALKWYEEQRAAALAAGTYWPAAPAGSITFPNPNYTPPKVTPAAVEKIGSDDVGWYITTPITPENPNGIRQVLPPHTPNADEEMNKYMTREQNEQLRRQRQTNEQNGLGYADDDTVAKRTIEMQKSNVDQEQVKARYAELAQKSKEFDRTQKTADDKAAQDILQSKATVGQIGATTGQIGANTAQINQNIDIAGQKLPYDLAQAAATTRGTDASTAGTQATTANQLQATQIAGAPQVQAPPTGMSQWARDPKTGAITQGDINPEWQAKTQADVAARVGQIQQLANAKKAEVMGKVGANYTADQAYAEFNNWYDKQVAPQVDMLKAAQNTAQIEQAKAQQAMRVSAMTTAQTGGQQALNAYQQLRESHPMNEKTQDVFAQIGQGKKLGNIDMRGAFQWEGPNPIDLAQQSTQNALKYIDRSSAEANGLPPPDFNGLDIGSMLGRQQYMPGGGAPPPAPAPVMAAAGGGAPPAPPPPAAPAATQPYDWAGLMQRQSDDANLQRQQAIMQRQAADVALQQQQALVPPYMYGG